MGSKWTGIPRNDADSVSNLRTLEQLAPPDPPSSLESDRRYVPMMRPNPVILPRYGVGSAPPEHVPSLCLVAYSGSSAVMNRSTGSDGTDQHARAKDIDVKSDEVCNQRSSSLRTGSSAKCQSARVVCHRSARNLTSHEEPLLAGQRVLDAREAQVANWALVSAFLTSDFLRWNTSSWKLASQSARCTRKSLRNVSCCGDALGYRSTRSSFRVACSTPFSLEGESEPATPPLLVRGPDWIPPQSSCSRETRANRSVIAAGTRSPRDSPVLRRLAFIRLLRL